jgi:cytidylate kinase
VVTSSRRAVDRETSNAEPSDLIETVSPHGARIGRRPPDHRAARARPISPASGATTGRQGTGLAAQPRVRHGEDEAGRVVASRVAGPGNREVAVVDRRFTIAIDGPAAAGKSTVGELVARKLSAVYFDTGLLYRAITRAALDCGVDPEDGPALARLARECDLRVTRPSVDDGRQSDVMVCGVDVTARIRAPDVDRNVSVVSAHAEVRDALLVIQRDIGRSGRIVMVGRDIGTVVLPEAEVKVFLDAGVEERARRRCLQLALEGAPRPLSEILADMRRRDAIDSTRDVAPLRPADDALVIGSDALDIEEVADRIVSVARERIGMAAPG